MATIYFPTTDAQISNAFVATLGAAPGSTYLALAKSLGVSAAAQVMINATGKTTASGLADTIVANLGLTGAAATSGKAYLLADIAAKGGVTSYGSGLVATLDLFASLTNDPTYGSFANIYVSRVNAATSYSQVAANNSTDLSTLQNVVGSATAVPGTTLTSLFTSNADDVRGSSGNDAATVTYGGTSPTLSLGDVANFGDGSDTLSVTVAGTGGINTVLDSVETVNLRMLVSATADMSSWSGVSTVNIAENSVNATDVVLNDPLVSNVNVLGGTHNVTLAMVDGLSGTTTLNLGANSASTTFTLTGTGVAETIALTASASSTVSLVVSAGTGAGAVTVAGSGTLNLNIADGTDVSALTTTNFAGSATYTLGTGAQHIVIGGNANETFDFGGAGGLQSTGSADTVSAGAGTDTVVAAFNGGTYETKNFSGVDVFKASAINGSTAVINASGNSGVAQYDLYGTGSFTVNNQSGDTTVNLLVGAGASTMTNTTVDMTSGNLTVTVGSAAQSAGLSVGSLTVTNASALSLKWGGSAVTQTLTTITADSDAKSLTLVGLTASASLATTSIAANGLQTISISTSGSGSITNTGAFLQGASALASVTISASGNGAGDIALGTGEIGSSTAVSAQGFALAVSGTDSADFGALPGVVLADAVSASSVTINLGSGSVMTTGFGTAILTGGSAASVGSLYVSAGDAATFVGGNATLAMSATGDVGGSIGSMTLRGASNASVTFSDINARSIGDISIALSATGATTIGTIAGTGNINGASVGNLSITGSAGQGTVAITKIAASAIGGITLSDANVTISDISSTGSIGSIVISGRGTYSANVGAASGIAGVNLTGMNSAGSVTLDLGGQGTRGFNIDTGSGTTTITEGTGQNTYTLRSGSGTDTIMYQVGGASADSITGFTIGSITASAGDRIRLDVTTGTGSNLAFFSYGDSGTAALAQNATGQASNYLAITGGSYGATTFGTGHQYVVISATAFGTVTEMIQAIATGGAAQITLANYGTAGVTVATAVGQSNADLLVVWTDGSNSYITSVDTNAISGGTGLIATNASSTTVATLQGISAAGLAGWNVANIDFE